MKSSLQRFKVIRGMFGTSMFLVCISAEWKLQISDFHITDAGCPWCPDDLCSDKCRRCNARMATIGQCNWRLPHRWFTFPKLRRNIFCNYPLWSTLSPRLCCGWKFAWQVSSTWGGAALHFVGRQKPSIMGTDSWKLVVSGKLFDCY